VVISFVQSQTLRIVSSLLRHSHDVVCRRFSMRAAFDVQYVIGPLSPPTDPLVLVASCVSV
jgi:hypothetical protein